MKKITDFQWSDLIAITIASPVGRFLLTIVCLCICVHHATVHKVTLTFEIVLTLFCLSGSLCYALLSMVQRYCVVAAPYFVSFVRHGDSYRVTRVGYIACFRKKSHAYVCFDEDPEYIVETTLEYSYGDGTYTSWNPEFRCQENDIVGYFISVAREQVSLPVVPQPLSLMRDIRRSLNISLQYVFDYHIKDSRSYVLHQQIKELKEHGCVLCPYKGLYESGHSPRITTHEGVRYFMKSAGSIIQRINIEECVAQFEKV